MTRAVAVASVLMVLSVSQVASAQAYDSAFRFGLGLDYAGLAGRNDGGAGGLRLTLGARLHEHFGLYYQGQALAGAFVSEDEVLATFMGWNAVLAEANLEIFSFGVGPSFDATARCTFATGQTSTASGGCVESIAPGLAARLGLRFDVLSFSGDLHVTFDDDAGPDVWVTMGVGMVFGDAPSRPMTMPSSGDADVGRSTAAVPEARAPVQRRRAAFRAERGWGRQLDDPFDAALDTDVLDADALEPEVREAPIDGNVAEAPLVASPPAPREDRPSDAPVYRAPEVRRFESGAGVPEPRTASPEQAPADQAAPPEPAAAAEPVRRSPPIEGLPTRGTDDPLEGLESFLHPH